MTRRLDARRLAGLVRGPGMDTRYHIALAVVDAVVVDPREGVFVDIAFMPGEESETALMGVPYAGNGFGFYFPVKQDDVVLVAIPDGDVNAGPVIISKMWCRADPPPAEVASETPVDGAEGMKQPSPDIILRAEAGANTRIIVSAGANITLTVEGAGNVNLVVADGSVNLAMDSNTPNQGVVNGQAIDSFTGATQLALGNASTKVFAKKT